MQEFVSEASVIGAIGGLIGLGLGWAVTTLVNLALVSGNQAELFDLSLRLVIISLAFAIGLGALAGVIPALRAAQLDPVTALRHQ
jgi:putative ABC transport system permease protein